MTVTGSNNKIACESELECGRWKGKPVGGEGVRVGENNIWGRPAGDQENLQT